MWNWQPGNVSAYEVGMRRMCAAGRRIVRPRQSRGRLKVANGIGIRIGILVLVPIVSSCWLLPSNRG